MKKIIMSAMLFACTTLGAFAEGYSFNIFEEGDEANALTLAFEASPVLTYADNSIVITTADGSSWTYAADRKYLITYTSTTAIQDAIANSGLQLKGGIAVLSSLKAGEQVNVYGIDGKVLASCNAGDNGIATLSLASLPAGMVVIKTDNASFKFKK